MYSFFLIVAMVALSRAFQPRNAAILARKISRGTKLNTLATDEGAPAPLKQLQVLFDCDEIDSESLSELLFEVGTLSVSVEVMSEKDILSDETKWADLAKTKSWATALLRANFPSSFDSEGLSEILLLSFPDVKFDISVVDVENKDWVSAVQKTWRPQVIGNLVVRFPWHDSSDLEGTLTEGRQELVLEGGAAFGTGDHPTTRLCCRWLDRELSSLRKSSASAVAPSVLDYGCGSAILGLASLKYGASRATGTDIDKDALISAQNNCDMNCLNMDFYLADDSDDQSDEERSVVNNVLKGYDAAHEFKPVSTLEQEGPVFDLCVANILAPILIHLAPTLASHLKVGGRIALSGLVSSQSDTVIKRYEQYFDDVKSEEEEDGWALITGIKR